MWCASPYGAWVAHRKICECYFWLYPGLIQSWPGIFVLALTSVGRYMIDIRASTVVPGTVGPRKIPVSALRVVWIQPCPRTKGYMVYTKAWIAISPVQAQNYSHRQVQSTWYSIALPSVRAVLGSFCSLVWYNLWRYFIVFQRLTWSCMHSCTYIRIKFLSFIIRSWHLTGYLVLQHYSHAKLYNKFFSLYMCIYIELDDHCSCSLPLSCHGTTVPGACEIYFCWILVMMSSRPRQILMLYIALGIRS